MFQQRGRLLAFYGRLAARNLMRQGTRTLLTLSAIVFGVTGLILAGGFIEDIFIQLGEGTIHSQVGHVQIYRTGYTTKGSQRPLEYTIEDAPKITLVVKSLPEVKEVMGRLNFSGLANNGHKDAPALIEGIEPSKESLVTTLHQVMQGRTLQESDEYGIYVGEGLAKALELRIGQSITLVVSTAAGALNTLEFDVVGIFRSYSKEYDARAARINLRTAHTLLQTNGANAIVVVLYDTSQTSGVVSKLRLALASTRVETMPWYELSDFYAQTVALFKRQFGFLQVTVLVLIVLSVLNTVNLSMYERRGEFGTMRAIGNRNGQIFRLILAEGLILGIAGSVVGAIIGTLLALTISAVGIPMPPPPNAELGYVAQIRLSIPGVMYAVVIGTISSVAACLAPGARISQMPIIDALRQNF